MFKYLIPLLFVATVARADYVPPVPDIVQREICSINVSEVIKELKSQGFKSMIDLDDKFNKEVAHKIIYDMNTDQILGVTLYKKDKICIDFFGKNPVGKSEVFRDFIIHQMMNDKDNSFKEFTKNHPPKNEEDQHRYKNRDWMENP